MCVFIFIYVYILYVILCYTSKWAVKLQETNYKL